MPIITLPDGNNLDFPKKITGLEVAEKISKSLAKQAMVMSVDGELKDFELLDSNKKPVFSSITVSLEPPILLAIIGFSIDWASTATLPKASGSIDADTTISETL